MPQQPFRGHVVVPTFPFGHVPTHRVSEAIVDVEQKCDFQRLGDGVSRHALRQHRAHIVGTELLVVERHLFEKAQHCTQSLVDGRGPIVIEDLPCEMFVVKGGRRDRGVGVRSKETCVQARHERRKQLTLADRPFRWTAHDRLSVRGMGETEEMASIPERPHDVGYTKP